MQPTPTLHSPEWFDVQFKTDAGDAVVPSDLRAVSEKLCRTFNIRGICDPMYIANVAAVEFERGDGCGQFDASRRQPDQEQVEKLAKRIEGSYGVCIAKSNSDQNPADVIYAALREARPTISPR